MKQPHRHPISESELYLPVKWYLENQGFEVKAEVHHCDLVAIRGLEPPVVVELKRSLNLELVLQAVDRTRIAGRVYVAVPEAGARARLGSRSGRRGVLRLFQMLGIGLMVVGLRTPSGKVRGVPVIDVMVEPVPYTPRKNVRHQRRLQREFHSRVGDFNTGGTHRTERLTAYRQDCLVCAGFLDRHGVSAPVAVKKATGVERAGQLLYRNLYGWFERPEAGRYEISDSGRQALERYHDVMARLTKRCPAP